MLKRAITTLVLCLSLVTGVAQTTGNIPKVYFRSEISPESLLSIFRALVVEPKGNIAVKISTGESAQSNHLRPELCSWQ